MSLAKSSIADGSFKQAIDEHKCIEWQIHPNTNKLGILLLNRACILLELPIMTAQLSAANPTT